jgi:3-deoxy-manno-octulosonate cytidylyltransferase (CMP-KDO synthetase)
VKVVTDRSGRALYFSRSPIPYVRGVGESEWIRQAGFQKHLGLYAYRSRVLQELANLEPGKLEKAESLEQLRWLEAGYRLVVGITDQESPGIDTPEDVRMAEVFLKRIS